MSKITKIVHNPYQTKHLSARNLIPKIPIFAPLFEKMELIFG